MLPLYGVHDRGDGVFICNCNRGGDCRSPGKHPPLKHSCATRDPILAARRQELVKKWSVCVIIDDNIRIAVLDFDGEEGTQTRKKIETAHGPLPLTWTQLTGRTTGGEHLFYRVPTTLNYYAILNRKIAPGLDVKGDAGLVVMSPTRHRSGNFYRWAPNLGMDDVELAELPSWMYKLMVSDKQRNKELSSCGERPSEDTLNKLGWSLERRLEAARQALQTAEPAIEGQNGSGACMRAAVMTVRGYCIPVEEPSNLAFDLLWEVYNPLCKPAWSFEELLHKVSDAENRSPKVWGFKFKFTIMGEHRLGAPAPPNADVQERLRAYTSIAPDPRRQAPAPPSRAEAWAPFKTEGHRTSLREQPQPTALLETNEDEDEGEVA